MTSKVLVVGSLNADLVLRVGRFPAPGETLSADSLDSFPGGKGGNQAHGAAKLGAAVSMVGQVGSDGHGDWLRSELASAGVDVSHVASTPGSPTGTAMITVDAGGQNQIIIVAGANGSFDPSELERHRAAFQDAKVVLLQLEIPLTTVERAAQLARASAALVVLDPAPVQPLSAALLASADYLTPNETELCLLTGGPTRGSLGSSEAEARARSLLERGARKVLVKLAERGALLVTPQGARAFPAFEVEAVDTTAAGDAFNAGFGYALSRGMDEARAIQLATAAGACAVTRRGAQPSMPTLAELQALLQTAAGATASSVW
jgi:ribokinase